MVRWQHRGSGHLVVEVGGVARFDQLLLLERRWLLHELIGTDRSDREDDW